MITNEQAFKALDKAKLFWDKTDFETIAVHTIGYRTMTCYSVERFLLMAGMVVARRSFDRLSGETITEYRFFERAA